MQEENFTEDLINQLNNNDNHSNEHSNEHSNDENVNANFWKHKKHPNGILFFGLIYWIIFKH